jgi:hypothetical protein
VRHLESGEVAAYLDGALAPTDSARVEAHAAECDMCRTELVEASWLLRTQPRVRRWYVPAGAVAAAAAVILLLWPRPAGGPEGASGYREPAVTTSVAPVAVAPRGVAAGARLLVWTGVPRADRYRLTLFDGTGSVVWETQTADTLARVPESIRLRVGASYFWKVEAQTGWNRWVASDLVEFSLGAPRP